MLKGVKTPVRRGSSFLQPERPVRRAPGHMDSAIDLVLDGAPSDERHIAIASS
jgi:hypothetical protein